jgi:excisionase family DNA binding protein
LYQGPSKVMTVQSNYDEPEEPDVSKLLYKIPEAAGLVSLGRTKFYEELDAGRIVSVRVGRSRLIPADALAAYVEHLRAEDGPERDKAARRLASDSAEDCCSPDAE